MFRFIVWPDRSVPVPPTYSPSAVLLIKFRSRWEVQMRAAVWVIFVFFAGLGLGDGQKQPESPESLRPKPQIVTSGDSSRLPVKRVVLYKNGVGYFEHSARVHGNQELGIDFTTAQLNDVLKSLTAVDLGEGKISSVRYNSIAPLEERLKTLRLPFGEQVTRTDFL